MQAILNHDISCVLYPHNQLCNWNVNCAILWIHFVNKLFIIIFKYSIVVCFHIIYSRTCYNGTLYSGHL